MKRKRARSPFRGADREDIAAIRTVVVGVRRWERNMLAGRVALQPSLGRLNLWLVSNSIDEGRRRLVAAAWKRIEHAAPERFPGLVEQHQILWEREYDHRAATLRAQRALTTRVTGYETEIRGLRADLAAELERLEAAPAARAALAKPVVDAAAAERARDVRRARIKRRQKDVRIIYVPLRDRMADRRLTRYLVERLAPGIDYYTDSAFSTLDLAKARRRQIIHELRASAT